jgi:Reverse transcriptase (RNA-dependent DNA polymerase)
VSILAIPTAVDLLHRQLIEPADVHDLALPLRALQLRGLTKLDLVVQVERLRAENDVGSTNPAYEEQCLLALDIIHGVVPELGLVWDARHEAASLLPRCLSAEQIHAAIPQALVASDLLPPRATDPGSAVAANNRLGTAVANVISSFSLFPDPAVIVRAPRGTFTTRPAALLRFFDRVTLEALTAFVDVSLATQLPEQVVWPRFRMQPPSATTPEIVLGWESDYVVKADITAFYASIQHTQLAVFLSTTLGLPLSQARAIEAMLTATMASPIGLPQGPPFSDSLATAYLLPIDQRLVDENIRFARYADDYFLAADTMGEGRELLLHLEALIGDVGLSLNEAKTYIMRQATYRRGMVGSGPAVRLLKERLVEARLEELGNIDDQSDAAAILEKIGVPEETTWDLLYHHTIDLDDVATELSEALGPDYASTYALFFRGIARQLKDESLETDLTAYSLLAQEALLLLATSDVDVSPADVALVQTWFPEATPAIVRCLIARARYGQKWARDYVARYLRNPAEIDWVDAWMCYAAASIRPLGRGAVVRLRSLASGDAAGPLTEVEAVRALAAHEKLKEKEWRHTFRRVPAAISAEMFLTALGSPAEYPWIDIDLLDATDNPLRAIAAAASATGQASRRKIND